MEKLDLNFQPKQILSASSLNKMVEKTNELVDVGNSVGSGDLSEFGFTNLFDAVKYLLDEIAGGVKAVIEGAVLKFSKGASQDGNVLVLEGKNVSVENNVLSIK